MNVLSILVYCHTNTYTSFRALVASLFVSRRLNTPGIRPSRASIETTILAIKKGAVDYLHKPINFEELLFRLNKIITAKEQNQILVAAEKNKEQAMRDLQIVATDLQQKFTRLKSALGKEDVPIEKRIKKALKILS